MNILVIIPAFNEEESIGATLESLCQQSYLPSQILVVDDHSTDRTAEEVLRLARKYACVNLLQHEQKTDAGPGAPVVRAFNAGIESINVEQYDLICKYDADLVFPKDYFERIADFLSRKRKHNEHTKRESQTGMIGGVCTIKEDGKWGVEGKLNKDHLRGALKAYTRECFLTIGGLRESIGWDTLDELLARYHDFEVEVISELEVKHLRPTGANYASDRYVKQGEAFYKLGYDLSLVTLTAAKLAPRHTAQYIKGYRQAKKQRLKKLVTQEQAKFIRKYRWQGIRRKLLGR